VCVFVGEKESRCGLGSPLPRFVPPLFSGGARPSGPCAWRSAWAFLCLRCLELAVSSVRARRFARRSAAIARRGAFVVRGGCVELPGWEGCGGDVVSPLLPSLAAARAWVPLGGWPGNCVVAVVERFGREVEVL
jgi:hypothetical protein